MGIMQGQIAIVTGAGTGLGKAIAKALANAGANVILTGRRKNKIEEVVTDITAEGGKASAIQADASLEIQVKQLIETVTAQYGRIDILINNAAVFESGQVIDTTLESWNYQLTNNLTSAFLMTQAVLPVMRKQRFGRIVNITSGLAVNGAGGYAAYSVSKAGLEALTRTVAEEENEYNILANLFNPGTVKSEMHATGQDPAAVAPDVVKLASLDKHGISGKLLHTGESQSS